MSLPIETLHIAKPYPIAKMGTSGMRATQEAYGRPLFLEQFLQGLADHFAALPAEVLAAGGRRIVVGGDPRLGNRDRVRRAAEVLAAAGFRALVAKDGLASTPAASHAIRHFKTCGGVILTASHNPFTDVGIKANSPDGAPSLEDAIVSIHEKQNRVTQVRRVPYEECVRLGLVEEFDAVKLYGDLLDSIFDFAAMRRAIAARPTPPRLALDSMHGAAGPFARDIFIDRLGLSPHMLRERPDEFLGGTDAHGHPMHPEPDFAFIPDLIRLNLSGEFDLVAAYDSDVDRRLDGGAGYFVESADEMALFAKYGDLIGLERLFAAPGGGGTIHFCRSTVTAGAIDLMGPWLSDHYGRKGYSVRTVETPTGFKWIAELGNWGVEESNGIGNPWLREKDGVFATAFLLKILLHTGKTPLELMEEIWRETGRVYFTRGEVSGSDPAGEKALTAILDAAPAKAGRSFAGLELESAENWDYLHPATGEVAARKAAYVLRFADGNTVKARFSGTGSGGYLMRVYCTKFDRKWDIPKSRIVEPMKAAFDAFLADSGFPGKSTNYTDAAQPEPYGK